MFGSLSISLCFFALFLALFWRLRGGILLSCALLGLCWVEILGYSLCEYYLAFFSAPSVLSLLLSLVFCAQILLLRVRKPSAPPRELGALVSLLPLSARLLIVALGLGLYLGVLGIAGVDLYHSDPRLQILLLALWVLVLAYRARLCALLASLALGYQVWQGGGLYEGVLDVGLWLVCVYRVLGDCVGAMWRARRRGARQAGKKE